jgi:hypothetical protein
LRLDGLTKKTIGADRNSGESGRKTSLTGTYFVEAQPPSPHHQIPVSSLLGSLAEISDPWELHRDSRSSLPSKGTAVPINSGGDSTSGRKVSSCAEGRWNGQIQLTRPEEILKSKRDDSLYSSRIPSLPDSIDIPIDSQSNMFESLRAIAASELEKTSRESNISVESLNLSRDSTAVPSNSSLLGSTTSSTSTATIQLPVPELSTSSLPFADYLLKKRQRLAMALGNLRKTEPKSMPSTEKEIITLEIPPNASFKSLEGSSSPSTSRSRQLHGRTTYGATEDDQFKAPKEKFRGSPTSLEPTVALFEQSIPATFSKRQSSNHFNRVGACVLAAIFLRCF